MQVIKSSLPVLMSVATEVRTKKKSEPRKKRSAGSEDVLAGSVVAMAVNFQSSTGGRGQVFRAAQTITLRRGLRRSLWSWRALRGRFFAGGWKLPAKKARKARKGRPFSPHAHAGALLP